ncbi:MAG: hypothetical protein FWE88_03880 [Phycisphaerae bacterium]|nr:hypothetical protein [Phycisphaerae bacterium]
MNKQERMHAFWAGERPDVVPLSIYGWFLDEYRGGALGRDPLMQQFLREGELIGYYNLSPSVTRFTSNDVVPFRESFDQDGRPWIRHGFRTPVGEIFALDDAGWRQKYLLEKADDYRVMAYVLERLEISPDYEGFRQALARLGPGCIGGSMIGRTPLQTILVDYTGLENFSEHLYECPDAMRLLYDVLLKNFRRQVEIAAGAPGPYVEVLENFTSETMGPGRFAEFTLPVYRELFPQLHAAGKIVGVHYDGKLDSCKDLIAEAPVDLIESLTEPPEGDMTLAQCRAAWPTKLFWVNLNLSDYDRDDASLRRRVLEAVAAGGVNGRQLAIEISEDVPPQWREKIPVILLALEETRG